MNRKAKLGEILVKAGLIDEFQLRSALAEQSRWGGRLGVTLVKMRFLSEADLVRTLSRIFGLPAAQISGKRISPEILELVEVEFAEKHGCIPLFKTREGGMDVLYLGMEDPRDLTAVDDLSFRLGLRVRPVLVGPIQLREAIAEYYRGAQSVVAGHAIELTEVPVMPGDTEPVMEAVTGPDAAAGMRAATGSDPAAGTQAARGSDPAAGTQAARGSDPAAGTQAASGSDAAPIRQAGIAPEAAPAVEAGGAPETPVQAVGRSDVAPAVQAVGRSDVAPAVDPSGTGPARQPGAEPEATTAPERAALFEMSRQGDLGPDPRDSGEDAHGMDGTDRPHSDDGDTLSEIHLSRSAIADAAAEQDATDPDAESAGDGSKPRDVRTRTILQAVTRLLIDKGILTRAEVLEAVRAAQERGE